MSSIPNVFAESRINDFKDQMQRFLFVEVNFSTSVFNINKSIWVLRKITKITNLLKKRFKVRHRRFVYILQVMTSYRENNDDDDQLK